MAFKSFVVEMNADGELALWEWRRPIRWNKRGVDARKERNKVKKNNRINIIDPGKKKERKKNRKRERKKNWTKERKK